MEGRVYLVAVGLKFATFRTNNSQLEISPSGKKFSFMEEILIEMSIFGTTSPWILV